MLSWCCSPGVQWITTPLPHHCVLMIAAPSHQTITSACGRCTQESSSALLLNTGSSSCATPVRSSSLKMTFPGDTNHGGHGQTTRNCSLGKVPRPDRCRTKLLTIKLTVCHGLTILSANFLGRLNHAHISWPTKSVVCHLFKIYVKFNFKLFKISFFSVAGRQMLCLVPCHGTGWSVYCWLWLQFRPWCLVTEFIKACC